MYFLGKWRIEASARSDAGIYKKNYAFLVEEYTLPPFEVTVKTDNNFLVVDDYSSLSVTVDALYTFGKPVSGDLKIKVTRMPCGKDINPHGTVEEIDEQCITYKVGRRKSKRCRERTQNGCYEPPKALIKVKNFKRSSSHTIPREDLKKLHDFDDKSSCVCGKNLLINATVTDKVTGKQISAHRKVLVETIKYKFGTFTVDTAAGFGSMIFGTVEYTDGSDLNFQNDSDVNITCKYEAGRDWQKNKCSEPNVSLFLLLFRK